MTPQLVGVDIGGTGIKAALVDLEHGVLAGERIREPTPEPATPAAIAEAVHGVVERLDGGGAVGVGVTLPAVVRHGLVETASNIDHSWIGTNALELFGSSTGRRVGVINDADAAGMAEMRYGAGKGHGGVVILLTLGTGIGCGLFVDGVLVPNTELGHLYLHHHGLAEEWAAESAREREGLSWEKWAERLTKYLKVVEALLWPELFIIGGGVSRQSDKFVPLLRCATPVVAAALHNDAGIVGAAMVAPTA
jgi:polyphosphate glucokinase